MCADHYEEFTDWQRRQLMAWRQVGAVGDTLSECARLLEETKPSNCACPASTCSVDEERPHWLTAVDLLGDGATSLGAPLEAACPSLDQVLQLLETLDQRSLWSQQPIHVLVTGSLYLVGDVLAQLQEKKYVSSPSSCPSSSAGE